MGLVISVNEFGEVGLPPVCAITGAPTDVFVDYPVGRTPWQSRLLLLAPGRRWLVRAGGGVHLLVPMSPGRAAAFRRSSTISTAGTLLGFPVGVAATVVIGWRGMLVLVGLLIGLWLATAGAGVATNIDGVIKGRMLHLRSVHPLLTEAWAGMGSVASPTREPSQRRVAKLDPGPPAPPGHSP